MLNFFADIITILILQNQIEKILHKEIF